MGFDNGSGVRVESEKKCCQKCKYHSGIPKALIEYKLHGTEFCAYPDCPCHYVPVEKSWDNLEERLSKKCPWLYRGNKFRVVLSFIKDVIKEAEERAVSQYRKRIVEEVKKMLFTLDDGFDKSTIPTVQDQRSLNKTTDWFRKKGSNDAVEYVISIINRE